MALCARQKIGVASLASRRGIEGSSLSGVWRNSALKLAPPAAWRHCNHIAIDIILGGSSIMRRCARIVMWRRHLKSASNLLNV